MRIGLVGSHRSGKTTLARLVAKEFNLEFIASATSEIVAKHGFDMAVDNRLDVGMPMQTEILNTIVNAAKDRDNFVADRTPIDVAAYLIADATAGAGTVVSREDAVILMEEAIRQTERLYDMVILVPPLPDFTAEAGKPPENPAYQEHHHMLCRGMLFDEDLDLYWDEIKRDTFSLEKRMLFMRQSIHTAFREEFTNAA